jgi:hypothetical protein
MSKILFTCMAQKNHESTEMEVIANNCTWDAMKALESYYKNTLWLNFKYKKEET